MKFPSMVCAKHTPFVIFDSSKKSVPPLRSCVTPRSARHMISTEWKAWRARVAVRVTLPTIFSLCSLVVAEAVAVVVLRRVRILSTALKLLWKICITERLSGWPSLVTNLALIAMAREARRVAKRLARIVVVAV